jgi:mannose-6-phosphate isomerase-like protein (cupin superfamily)
LHPDPGGIRTRQEFPYIYFMEKDFPYVTLLDIKYKHLEKIDVNAIVAENKHKWFNQTLTKVNDSVVRIGIVEGEYHWHKHDHDDEFFFVLSGQLLIDLEDRTVTLGPGEGFTITKGVMHRTRAQQKTVMLMVENSGIIPTGD